MGSMYALGLEGDFVEVRVEDVGDVARHRWRHFSSMERKSRDPTERVLDRAVELRFCFLFVVFAVIALAGVLLKGGYDVDDSNCPLNVESYMLGLSSK